jgi:hypothetical protein
MGCECCNAPIIGCTPTSFVIGTNKPSCGGSGGVSGCVAGCGLVCNIPLWCKFMSDTYGTAYSALTGKVDPYTKDILIKQEQSQLIKAGMNPTAAAQVAQKDTSATLKLNKACPCCSSHIPSWAWWAIIAVALLIVFYIFTKAAAQAAFE